MNPREYDPSRESGIAVPEMTKPPREVMALREERKLNEDLRAALLQRAEEVHRENQLMRETLEGPENRVQCP